LPHVRKTVLAEQDLDDIWFSIALDNPDVADAILDRIGSVSVLLAENREMGRARPELLESLRSFPAGNYILFYRPEAGGIELTRVLHGARDVPAQFQTPREGSH